MKREGVTYTLHHIGIPTEKMLAGKRFSRVVGMYTTDDLTGPIPIQRHRFEPDAPLHLLMRTQPHMAYKVSDLMEVIKDHRVIPGPYEPIDDYQVAVTDNAGVPIEFIETMLSDHEIWRRARTRNVLHSTANPSLLEWFHIGRSRETGGILRWPTGTHSPARFARSLVNSALEQIVACAELRRTNPGCDAIASLFGDFELHWERCFLVQHRGARGDALAMTDVAHSQLRQVASSRLAVDG